MDYYMVLPFVVAIIFDRQGRIVIGKHPDLPHKPYPGLWDLPGGKKLPYETPEECILREVVEETGLYTMGISLLAVYSHDGPRLGCECRSQIPSLGICFTTGAFGRLWPAEMVDMHWATGEEVIGRIFTPWAEHFLQVYGML